MSYLAFSANRRLASINDPPPRPQVTIEDLNRVQEERERLLKRIEQVETQIDEMPDVMSVGAEMAFLDPLKQQLEWTDRQISSIQTELERGTK